MNATETEKSAVVMVSCWKLELLALENSISRYKIGKQLVLVGKKEGERRNVLREVDIEKVEVETRLDQAGCDSYRVDQSFREVPIEPPRPISFLSLFALTSCTKAQMRST